jgi:NAD(P)-dependent dehydrogenase (short-subunit alcohol dehydrogenase family)
MKNFVVIGHSTGIGAAIREELSKDNVVFGSYYKNSVALNNGNVNSFYLNVLDEQLDLSVLPDVIDGIVYCPGAIQLKPFARIPSQDFLADYQLQVLGAIKVIQTILPKLKAAEQSSIVLMSTVAVQTGFNFHSIVSASKGALEGLTKALAAEFAPKIRVNCIAPSITQTPLAGQLLSTPEKITANADRHPLKKIGQPEDIAHLACFLLTDKSSWMTGQILHADGGMSTVKV